MPKTMVDFSFEHGLNADLPDILVSDSELITATNARIIARGGVKKRNGVSELNSTSYSAQVEQLIPWPRDDGTEDLLAIVGTDLCDINTSTGAKTVIQALTGTWIAYFYLNDNFYFIDQGDEYYVYDGTSCAAVTPAADPDNDIAPIRRCKYAYYHSESQRIFFAGDTSDRPAVYFSESNDPTYVKNTSVMYPTRADGPVRGLAPLMDAMVVGYRYSNWIWRGIDPESDTIWEKLPTAHGPLNGDVFTLTTNSLSMVSNGGIFTMSPSIIGVPMDTEVGSQYIHNIAKNRVKTEVDNVTDEDMARAVFDSDNGIYMVSLCDDGTGRNNKTIVYDWELSAFAQDTGLSVNDYCKMQDGTLYAALDNYIVEMNTGYQDIDTDDGSADNITFTVKTGKYSLKNPLQRKIVSAIYIIYKNLGTSHEIEVTPYVDDEAQTTFTLSGDATSVEIITYRKKVTYVGNYFQLEITNDQNLATEIYGIGFEYDYVSLSGEKV